jgi:hypothetical protein
MFARVKKSGKYQYLQIVENRKEKGKVKQRVIVTVGRLDQLHEKDRVETLIRSLSRFSEKASLILSGRSETSTKAVKIGPTMIFERLWKETGIQKAIRQMTEDRKFEFDIERALFLTVLHRLMEPGSDRACDRWRRDYRISDTEKIELHHLYRAMNFLGEELDDQAGATPFSPRCTKDRIEELLFASRRDLFSALELVFFDTTSIYFEGQGGNIGQRGFSKDHRPDLKQMVVGAVIDDHGRPVCCEIWPGNTADVKTLLPVADRLRRRFGIQHFCIVADRGMISSDTVTELEKQEIPYILGVRMRRVKDVRDEVLSRPGRFSDVYPEGVSAKDPSPLKVKEVILNDRRYIVCCNSRQARKDAADREAIIDALKEQLKKGAVSLVGNKGYRRYLKINRNSASIDRKKVEEDARFDGKWVLTTNTNLPAGKIALKYKELWQVERVFRDVKTLLETRPIFHQRDENIRGHVFCSFLALILRKELEIRLNNAGHDFEWPDIKRDLAALQIVNIEEDGKRFALRTECQGCCGKIFQAVRVALPPVIREVA